MMPYVFGFFVGCTATAIVSVFVYIITLVINQRHREVITVPEETIAQYHQEGINHAFDIAIVSLFKSFQEESVFLNHDSLDETFRENCTMLIEDGAALEEWSKKCNDYYDTKPKEL